METLFRFVNAYPMPLCLALPFSPNGKCQLSVAGLRFCAGKRGIDKPDVAPGSQP